jgi:hypothetical protein
MREQDRLLRSLAKAEDAAFKNLKAYLEQRDELEALERSLPSAGTKRPRGRPRGSGLEVLRSRREVQEHYAARVHTIGRQLTMREFAQMERVGIDLVVDRVERFKLRWPPI